MKKLLAFISALSLTSATLPTVIACGEKEQITNGVFPFTSIEVKQGETKKVKLSAEEITFSSLYSNLKAEDGGATEQQKISFKFTSNNIEVKVGWNVTPGEREINIKGFKKTTRDLYDLDDSVVASIKVSIISNPKPQKIDIIEFEKKLEEAIKNGQNKLEPIKKNILEVFKNKNNGGNEEIKEDVDYKIDFEQATEKEDGKVTITAIENSIYLKGNPLEFKIEKRKP